MRNVCSLIAFAVGASLSPGGARAADAQVGDCFSSWSEAAPVVKREGLATIERVNRLARDRAAAQIVNGKLCQDSGRYVYRLVVREANGPLKTLVVDAREPFGR